METAKSVLEKMKMRSASGKPVRDWQDMIPKGSKWFPGCPGDPTCKVCEGMGYVRFDVPISSPYFGRVYLCDCVAVMQSRQAARYSEI